jgi:hypothetical protein
VDAGVARHSRLWLGGFKWGGEDNRHCHEAERPARSRSPNLPQRPCSLKFRKPVSTEATSALVF